MVELIVGTRVYNGGDMANASHFGTITAIKTSKWGTNIEITPDADSDRSGPYNVPQAIFSPKYLGHGGTRLVTEAAYQEFRKEQMAQAEAFYAKYASSK